MSTLASNSAKFQLASSINSQFGAQVAAPAANSIVTLQNLGQNSALSTWIQPQAGGPIYLASTYNTSTPLVLDISLPIGNGDAFISGNGCLLYLNNLIVNSQTQQWLIHGTSLVTVKNTGLSTSLNQTLVLDVARATIQAFAALEVWSAADNAEQHWLQLAV